MKTWWGMTRKEILIGEGSHDEELDEELVYKIIKLITDFLILFTQRSELMRTIFDDENVILMVDAFGPNFTPTHTTMSPMIGLPCPKSIRAIRIAQLFIIGYRVLPLTAAFTTAPFSGERTEHEETTTLVGFNLLLSSVVRRETRRLGKFASMWR